MEASGYIPSRSGNVFVAIRLQTKTEMKAEMLDLKLEMGSYNRVSAMAS